MDCEYTNVENGEKSFMDNDSSPWMNIPTMAHKEIEIPGMSTLDESSQVFSPCSYPIAPLKHVGHFPFAKPSHHVLMQNQGICGNFPSYLSQCPSDLLFVEQITRNSSLGFEKGSFSKLTGSFGMNQSVGIVRSSSSIEESHVMDRNRMLEEVFRRCPPNERMGIHQPNSLCAFKDNGGDEKRNHSEDTYGQMEEKEKYEQNPNTNVVKTQKGTEAKIMSWNEESSKENYTNVRARRGQATNSHSLAERVRREKIGERMRLLQELVPGCNKITGKAVMLDEIINYVQSLQQQIEFLSMKLATVKPLLVVDLERITSEHDLQSRVMHTTALQIDPAIESSHPYMQGILHKSLPANPYPSQGYHTLHQHDHWGFEAEGAT